MNSTAQEVPPKMLTPIIFSLGAVIWGFNANLYKDWLNLLGFVVYFIAAAVYWGNWFYSRSKK